MATTNSTIKLVSITIPVDLEYRTLWSKSKGYKDTITTFNATTGQEETSSNPESIDDFFAKTLKQELLSIAIQPINNMIYAEINKQAQDKISALNSITQEKLQINITNA